MDTKTAERILSLARSAQADAAEVYLRSAAATTVEVKDRQVESFEKAKDIGAGLRVLAGGRLGFAFTTDLSDDALAMLARNAVANARGNDPDPRLRLPERPAVPYAAVDIHDPAVASLGEEEQIERALAMEREAFAADPRVKRIRKASVRAGAGETVIASSNGVTVSYRGTFATASIEVVAEDKGESQAGWEADASRFYARLDAEGTARRAARKALNLLGARSVPSVKAPVILERSVAEEVLSLLAAGLSAESVQKRRSLFMGKLGEQVLSPLVTVIDDGLLDRGPGTAPADDEGVPMRRKTVIDKGRLALFLHNTYTAGKDGTGSTGNAVRGGFKGVPGVGVTNLFIEPGTLTPDEVIAGTGQGLYVLEVMGAHTANPISGDFSVGATGFWIEGGKIAFPVREVTIAGNILDLMQNVDAVCSDIRHTGRIACPTLRVKELSISGT